VQWLRSVVSIVQQEPSLFATTIERNLKLGKDDLSQEEMIHVCKMANAHDFIMQLPHVRWAFESSSSYVDDYRFFLPLMFPYIP
jgi:ABC-type multidrug transport system fused ATPase/permease subunit